MKNQIRLPFNRVLALSLPIALVLALLAVAVSLQASVGSQVISSHSVSGSANVLGYPASQGTLVRAWDVNRQVADSSVDSSGNYSLSVPVNTSNIGQTITFTVGDQISDGTIQLAAGGYDEVNLDAGGCGRALPRQGTTGTVEDSLVSACELQESKYRYAKYYYFVLDRTAEIRVSMDSVFDDYLYLYSGVGRHGPRIVRADGDMVRSLGAGTYTIAASSFSSGNTGRFTLTVSGLPGVTGTPTPPQPLTAPSHSVSGSANVLGYPASQGTLVRAWDVNRQVADSSVDSSGNYSLSVPVNTSNIGQTITFTVGDQISDGTIQLAAGGYDEVNLDAGGCGRALPRQGTTGTVEDSLVSACELQESKYRYAKYYYFVLDRTAEIRVSMDSVFDDYLYLYSGVGRHGPRIVRADGDMVRSLGAGTYTIAASSFSSGNTGRFTLTVSGLPGVTGTPTPPQPLTAPSHSVSGSANVLGYPASQGTLVRAWDVNRQVADSSVDSSGNYSLSVPVNTSNIGQTITFTVGDQISDGTIQLAAGGYDEVNLDAGGCGRALPRQGTTGTVEDSLDSACELQESKYRYAKYYYFVLDRTAEIRVSMDSVFDDYLYLYSGVGRHGPRIVRADGDMVRSLGAGTYTIAASSFSSGNTGRFTLTVSGLPRPKPPLPGAAAIVSVSPGAGSLTVSWSAPPGDASGITAYDLRHIRTDANETVDANWTVVAGVWTGSGSLRYPLIGLDGGVQYDVQVRAVNSVGRGPWSATATGVTVALSNAPPVFTATRSIPENATEGHSVGAPFAAIDPDGDPLSYALSGADSGSFVIGRTSGQITLAAGVALDHEAKASYAVTVTATDGGGLSASIAVTINVTVVDGLGPPADSCVQPIDVNGAAVSGAWSGDCPSENQTGSYARYYSFTLTQNSEVTIILERTSGDANTYLNLLSGSGKDGSVLHSNDDDGGTSMSRIQETLPAGTYTIEATTYAAGQTGSFTLTVEGLGSTTAADSCLENLSRDGTFTGQWASGCESETVSKDGSGDYPHARYYSFTLTQNSEVTITLESQDSDTLLYLREGDDTRSGAILYEDDDSPDQTRSQIGETLPAGTYTIEATTYAAGQTGSFTLTVEGLGSTTAADSCLENLSRDGTFTGQWASGCESETVSKDGSGDYPHARYYSFTLTQNSEVTITLESQDSDTLLYLREGDDTRSGAILYEDDDSPDQTRSQIGETLPAGTYTIEATTYAAGQTGSFTLTVEGL